MRRNSLGSHPHDEALAAYVGNILDAAEVEPLEAHIFECDACAQRLQQAARIQQRLHRVAHALEHHPVARLRRRLRLRPIIPTMKTFGGLWVTAAALVAIVYSPTSAPPAPAPSVGSGPTAPAVDSNFTFAPESDDRWLASIDRLQSIDPLQTWPDDPFDLDSTDPAFEERAEPCGSGEDGGPLVCQHGAG